MAKKRRIKTVILSDSDSDSAIVKRASVFPTPAMQALMSSYSEPAGASQEKAEGDAKIEPIEPAKSKGKPKGKWSRMLKELGDHNDRPETQSDVGSPEILLEGLHRTRATRQNLRNAVNNQAPEARKSMNMKALMEEALKAGPIQIGPGKKKGFKHEPVEEDIDDASSDIEEEEVKPSPRRKRRVLQREDTEEEMGEADDAVSVEASEQQMRKDHYDVSIGLEMVEDLHAFVSKAKSPKSGTKLEKQRVLELRQSREEGSDDDDDDGFLPIATPDLKAQPTKAPRRSLRTVPPVRTVAFGTNRSQPKVMTSQMAWDDKKGSMCALLATRGCCRS